MRALALALTVTLATGTGTACIASAGESPGVPPSTTTPLKPVWPYEAAIDAAARRGLHVWIDADLVKRWAEGPASFATAVGRVANLAQRPGVVGVKIADELGYEDGLQGDQSRVTAFLRDAAQAIRAAAPGTWILVDLLVPELGCAPDVPEAVVFAEACRVSARAQYPDLTVEAVDGYLRSGTVDVVNLSTGLLDPATYRSWGIDRTTAQRAAWREVANRGWDRMVELRSRRSLAHAGVYGGTRAQAEDDVRDFVDVPLESGATVVDLWTWRQSYQGELWRLMDPGLAPNPLWSALTARRQQGARLSTAFSPSSVEVAVDADLDVLAGVFRDVFVPAGTG